MAVFRTTAASRTITAVSRMASATAICLQSQTTIWCLPSSSLCVAVCPVGIVKASQVNSLYMAGQYQAAVASAADAKKWSMIGLISGLVINAISFIFYFMAGMCSAMM